MGLSSFAADISGSPAISNGQNAKQGQDMDWDDAYANSAHIPEAANIQDRWVVDSAAFRKRLAVAGRARLGVMYGHGTRQSVDVFHPEGTPKGLLVFVHGGYWRQSDGTVWSHFSQGALDHGWAVAMPTYDLCPRVRIADITRQIAQAITVVAHDYSGPIRLTGHSAGGHLVARMLDTRILPSDVRIRVDHVVPISPLSDLRPLLKTKMNDDFGMTEASAMAESPVLMPKPDTAVTVWVGSAERPVFLDQARWLSDAWACRLIIDQDKHHFDIIDGLEEADSPLMRSIMSPSA
jgi:arylformamidase